VLTQGGRIEGTARRRGNLGIAGAQVQVMNEGERGPFGSSTDVAMTGADGAFVIDHVPAGRVRVILMTREGGSTFAGSQTREAIVQEGQTSTVEFFSREILLSGRVTTGGAPLPGVRLSLNGVRSLVMSYGGSGAPAPVAGPQRMVATTREDGSYEMLVDEPGPSRMGFSSSDGRSLPGRPLEVPDAEAFTADFDFWGISIAGVVVDKETEQPVAGAFVFAIPNERREGLSSSQASTGADGRFQLEVDAGEYRVRASAQGRGSDEQEVTVGATGAADLRFEIVNGSSVRGKVLDVRGRPASAIEVRAMAVDVDRGMRGFAMSRADGSFTLEGLSAESLVLLAGRSAGMAYGMAGPIAPGGADVVVRLRPAARVQVTVLGPDGTPAKDVHAGVTNVNGRRIGGFMASGPTDENGVTEVITIAGALTIKAGKLQLEGSASVNVAEGGTAQVEIRLAPAPPFSR
jgi:hypothetical protein